MESEKLLPCPFCGAEDKYLVQAFTQATETFAFWSVECSFCGVEVADDESQEKANAAWNTRAPAELTGWQPIETAPKDGTPFFVWADGYEWPEVIKWFDYDEDDREELGEDGYFAYAEQLLAEACDPIDLTEFTHWQPLPAPPGTTRAPADLRSALEAARAEVINTPETADFMAGVPLGAAHQRDRWGVAHDAGKGPLDWFWLIGYLAQKAATAEIAGDMEKAKHHTISTAAALANWHARLTGADMSMRPGIDPAEHALAPTKGDVS